MRPNWVCWIFLSVSLQAKDFGQIGEVFKIRERSLLEVILERLNTAQSQGLLEIHQKKLADSVEEKLFKPAPQTQFPKATQSTSRLFDPTLTVAQDIKTPQGKVIARQGQRFNPLDHSEFGEPMLFIDGEDDQQRLWAQQQAGQIILVRGHPIRFEEALHRPVYFDQQQRLCQKLQLHHFPSRVSQQGRHLLIEEIGDLS